LFLRRDTPAKAAVNDYVLLLTVPLYGFALDNWLAHDRPTTSKVQLILFGRTSLTGVLGFTETTPSPLRLLIGAKIRSVDERILIELFLRHASMSPRLRVILAILLKSCQYPIETLSWVRPWMF